MYRNFEITYSRNMGKEDWEFAHVDYDGPPDDRCGTGISIADCESQIDEIIFGWGADCDG